jgi:hypothetical protein
MPNPQTLVARTAIALIAILISAAAPAQTPQAVSPEDAAAIQALVSGYARTLGTCAAEPYADLFAPGTGYFASGFRGRVVGRDRLIALVQSERHCNLPAGTASAPRPGGNNGPTVSLEVTTAGVRGTADLGGAGQYQDEYVKTSAGWRFAARTVLTPAEKAAGLDAAEMAAIHRLAGSDLVDSYAADQGGVKRFRASGVAISVASGRVTGRVFLKDGGHYDDVYEKTAPGRWQIASRVRVPPTAP